MDKLTIHLNTDFMKSLVAKLISKIIRKQIGCDVSIYLNDISLTHSDGKIRITADIGGEMKSDDFAKIVKDNI